MSSLLHPLVGRTLGGAHVTSADLDDAAIGRPTWGPASLLADLEMRAALVSPPAEPLARLDAFRAALAERPGVFAASLALDPWGSARAAAEIRDELIAGGWDGAPIRGGARIEAVTALPVALPPGEPERVRALLPHLRQAPYAALTVAEPLALWPAVWRRVFAHLSTLGTVVTIAPRPAPSSPPGADLGDLQRALATGASRFHPRGDGSLELYQSETVEPLSEAIAALLADLHPGTAAATPAVVVTSIDHAALDAALAARGLPRLGGVRSQRAPTASAWLSLILRLAAPPFDPEAAIDLVLQPGHGLPRFHIDRLASALSQSPGLGSRAFVKAAAAAAAAHPEPFGRLVAWLTPAALADTLDGEDLGRRLDSLTAFLRPRSADRERDLSAEATALARATLDDLVRTLPRSGPVATAALDGLLALLSERAARAATRREAGHLLRADAPEAFLAPVDHVVWWGFVEPHRPSRTFRPAEARLLAAHGITVADPTAELVAQAHAATDLVMRARRSLALAIPVRLAGELQSFHPLWSEVTGRHLADPAIAVATALRPRRAPAAPVAPRPLPPATATWAAPAGALVAPKSLSVSNLERLLGCPLKGVLDQTRLRGRAHGRLEGGPMLLGNLGHLLIERLFAAGRLGDPAGVDDLLPPLFADEAAHLLRPGRAAARRHLERVYRNAVTRLVAFLEARGLTAAGVEQSTQITLEGLVVTLRTDLRARDAAGAETVIDLKWSTGSHKRALDAGRAVPLAAYVQSLGANGVFFGIMRGNFVEARAPVLAETWRRVGATLGPLQRLLARGVVPVSGLALTPLAGHLELHDRDALAHNDEACRYCSYGVLCGSAFAGRHA